MLLCFREENVMNKIRLWQKVNNLKNMLKLLLCVNAFKRQEFYFTQKIIV